MSSGSVTMQSSTICPKIVDITISSSGDVSNICAAEELAIRLESSGDLTMKGSSICPKNVTIWAAGSGKVSDVCASEQLTILSATGSNDISMYYT